MNKNRIYFFYGILIIGCLVLLARLFELQIIFGAKNRALAEGNRIRRVVNPAPRGIIYDRQGKPLVRNVPVYREKLQSCRVTEWQSKDCFKLITREEALTKESRGETENLRMDVGRDYVYGSTLAHVLGYLGEVDEEEVGSGKWKMGDLVGRMGVEEEYDQILRGQDGGEIFEVDNRENKIRLMGKIEPVSGQNIYLSLDSQLSKVAYNALEGKPGAVVATEAKTGQVLVLVSSPSFDPNMMRSEEVGRGKWEEWLNDSLKPLFNRAIGGQYPPGSTFKIVTAAAGIQEDKVDRNTLFNDPGEIRIGEYVYRNWYFTQYGKVEGEIDLVRAIKRSTDTFFYQVGEWVGATQLSAWGKAFGLGRKTGIDLPGEVAGLVPDPEWKERVKGERWFLGNTYHLAIGQADLLATPLQANMMTAVIANDGLLCKPRVFFTSEAPRNIGGRGGREGSRPRPEVDLLRGETECQDIHLKEETLRLIKEGMKEACSSGGTAFPFFDFSPQVGCKTGTAEFGDPQNRTHAWLTAFAPASAEASAGKPAIVVTALVEGGGEGAYVATPIVKEIMEAWFGLDTSEVAG